MIRKATPADAPALAAVEMLTAPEFATFLLEGLFGESSVGAILSWRYGQGGVDSTDWSWVAEDGDATLGAIGAYPVALAMQEWGVDTDEIAEHNAHFQPIQKMMRPDAFHIARLGVLPQARRRGVATALVETACTTARERGDGLVTLVVWADNASALALYDRLGFRQLDATQIVAHPRLAKHGKSLLLGKNVSD